MDITPLVDDALLLIQRYGRDGIVINQTHYTDAIALLPRSAHAFDSAPALDNVISYQPFIDADDCSIVLVGTGAQNVFIPPSFRRIMREQHGLTLDSMDTGAACRTYNILAAEDRPVGALLLPVT